MVQQSFIARPKYCHRRSRIIHTIQKGGGGPVISLDKWAGKKGKRPPPPGERGRENGRKGVRKEGPPPLHGPRAWDRKGHSPRLGLFGGEACLLLLNHDFQEIATIYLCILVLTKDFLTGLTAARGREEGGINNRAIVTFLWGFFKRNLWFFLNICSSWYHYILKGLRVYM